MIKVHKDCTGSTDSIITKDKRDLDDFVETLCVDSRKTVSRQGSLGQGFFSCSLCQESFDTLTKYRTHNYEHLKRNFVLGLHLCTICSMGFKDKRNLIRHRRRGSCEPFHPSQDSDTSDCEPDFTKNISHRFKHNSNATQPDIAEIDRLTWDAQHRVNVERTYCYCGGPGLWSKKMLQCCRCRQWFHEACIQCLDHPLMTGDKFYVFVCSHCNAGPEYIKRLEMTWSDVIHLALYCMSSQCGLPKKLYEEEEIIEFINSHWEQLQLKQFSEVTSEDRKAKILEELSSPCNRRFSNGQELGKPATLWSLRQRLPPPAPTIMLPFEGKVTEAVMQTLQLIGKGRVKYLVPKDSPILTDLIKTEKPDGGIKDKVKETAESAPALRPSSGFPLDRLIPFPDNFTGYNHPFKTEVEQREERHFEFRKMQIMNYLCLNSDGDCLSQHSTASCSTDDPTKAIPTPPPSLSGGHISDLPYPTKQSDIKDSRKRKAPEDNPPSSLRQSKRKRVSVSGRYGIDPDIMDFQSLDDLRSLDEYSEKFKMGVNNYNSTSDRLKKGEKYKVLGKRISPDGKVHYLVQWEGLITKDK
ncbi:hypothetical protein FSP39_012454 [Pinctada imbricata]|uniref:C2H2-type domain-containing protein n=1 Tax=Pinctada imbricata TaxID=66713 RepID=A0AA88XV86_PINIB|nr:hypothetical protein FSP39_012454 [Pinctada imbricata]